MKTSFPCFLVFLFVFIQSSYGEDNHDSVIWGSTMKKWDNLDWEVDLVTSLGAYEDYVFIAGDFSKKMVDGNDEIKVHNIAKYNLISGFFETVAPENPLPSAVRSMLVEGSTIFVGGDHYKLSKHDETHGLVGRLSAKSADSDWVTWGPNYTTAGLESKELDETSNSVRSMVFEALSETLFISFANQVLMCQTSKEAGADRWAWEKVGEQLPGMAFVSNLEYVAGALHPGMYASAVAKNSDYKKNYVPKDWDSSLMFLPMVGNSVAKDAEWSVVGLPVSLHVISQLTVIDDQLLVGGWSKNKEYVFAAPLSSLDPRNATVSMPSWRTVFFATSDWSNNGNSTSPLVSPHPQLPDTLVVAGRFAITTAGLLGNDTVRSFGALSGWKQAPSVTDDDKWMERLSQFGGEFVGSDWAPGAFVSVQQIQDGHYNYTVIASMVDWTHYPREIGTGDYIMLGFVLIYAIVSILGTVYLVVHCNREGCCFKCCRIGSPPTEDQGIDIFAEDYSPLSINGDE